ncbi:MAG: HAD-IA family hydrolase [bacterium]
MIKLAILDFDDTLCLTEEACFYIENQIAVEMGHSPMSRDVHKKNWGKPLDVAIQERIPGVDQKEFMNRIGKAIEMNVKNGKMDSIPTHNYKALDLVKKSGKRLAVLTSRTFGEMRHLLELKHPINDKIEKIYHKDNSKFIKPDPRAFDQILHDFNVSPAEAVYIGDAVTDAIASKEAGLHFVAVLESGLRSKKEFEDKKVDFFAPTFVDAISYVLNYKRIN